MLQTELLVDLLEVGQRLVVLLIGGRKVREPFLVCLPVPLHIRVANKDVLDNLVIPFLVFANPEDKGTAAYNEF